MAKDSAAAEAAAIDKAESAEVLGTEEEAPPTRDYLEYLGDPNDNFGTTFLTTHVLPKGDGLWKRAGVTVNKDIVWERDPYGPPIGTKGNRMLVPLEDLPAGVAQVLDKLPNYRRVSV